MGGYHELPPYVCQRYWSPPGYWPERAGADPCPCAHCADVRAGRVLWLADSRRWALADPALRALGDAMAGAFAAWCRDEGTEEGYRVAVAAFRAARDGREGGSAC